MSTDPNFPAWPANLWFGSAWPGINVLENCFNCLKMLTYLIKGYIEGNTGAKRDMQIVKIF